MKMVRLFDAHTHLKNINRPYGKIVCASNLMEWQQLAAINSPDIIPAYGIHPWYATDSNLAELEKYVSRQGALLGECGLDRTRPYEMQEEVFTAQLEMARAYGKIVVIHCVRAWDVMTGVLKRYGDLSFLFHRFQGTAETVRLLPENSYFSLALSNIEKYLPLLPHDRVLFETDEADYDIAEVYAKSGLSPESIYANAKRLLGGLL